MTQDGQVRKLFCLLSQGVSLRLASLKTGMDEKTARKYRKAERMPSELSTRHDWRTRSDPFSTVWELVEKQLQENPGLQAKALFAWLQGEYPGQFQNGQLRTFQRGVHRWRAALPQKSPEASDYPPEVISCAECDIESPDSLAEALRQGWTRLQTGYTGLTWNYLGICPSCKPPPKEPVEVTAIDSRPKDTLF